MNFRVVDEHGRQLGMGRNLGALKAELGAKARGAFQALAGLKMSALVGPPRGGATNRSEKSEQKHRCQPSDKAQQLLKKVQNNAPSRPRRKPHRLDLWRAARADGNPQGGQTLIGFPALIDAGDAVTIEVFDEPEVAAAKHRAGLRRLFALQIKDALKYLEKNIPDLQKMAVAYMPLGTQEELRGTRSSTWRWTAPFCSTRCPPDEAGFKAPCDEGRGRLTLIANEVARLAATILPNTPPPPASSRTPRARPTPPPTRPSSCSA
jgi:ATP-dependent helicase HrpA